MRMPPRLAAALILAALALPAHADIYKWVDKKGQVNYSNTPPPQAAAKAKAVEDKISVMGMDPAVRAWADRHFADKARAEELDWQVRQQALAAQRYSEPVSYGYGDTGYGYASPYYYGGLFYAGHRRPIHGRPIAGNLPRPMPHRRAGSGARHSSHR